MRVVISDPAPPAFEALLEHRRRIGIDRRDEVWDGVLHMNPARHRRHARLVADLLWVLRPFAEDVGLAAIADFNIGTADNFRIPDCALVRPGPDELWNPTAALVVEVASPGDESWEKLGFYAARAVDELLIVALEDRNVDWVALGPGGYEPVECSGLIELGPARLAQLLHRV